MESIVRDVRDIEAGDRHALEHLVGRQLRDNQRLIIQLAEIENPAESASSAAEPGQVFEDWTHFYDGLSDHEVDEIDKIIKTRANLTRYLELP
jgi:hypothetical protein